KISFIKSIRIWGIIFLLILAGTLILVDVSGRYHNANMRADQIRTDYIDEQRNLIKSEVNQVVKLINFEAEHVIQQEQDKVKERVYEAHAIAENIYQQHKSSKSNSEIRQIIINAIRPIRFDRGSGYYFINRLDGNNCLFADHPEHEGTSMLGVQDKRGQYVIQDMIDIVTLSDEGFYRYHWTKPNHTERDFLKLSFVKRFEPLDWFIGTGIYLDAVETAIQRILSAYIENHRFGPNRLGYVFIYDLVDIQGGDKFAIMYANPNRPDLIGKYISDEMLDAKGKMFRKEFLLGLREQGECYVDYWYKKFNNLEPSPKSSFFKLTEDGRFIVAAGVYLDDVEETIFHMQVALNREIKSNVQIFVFAVIATIIAFILLWNLLSRRLKNDFNLFSDFFNRAAHSSAEINRDLIRFVELDQMAEFANQMRDDKAVAEKALFDEREQLLVTLHSIVDGVITTDMDGRIGLINQVAETLTGWNQTTAAGKALEDIFTLSQEKDRGSAGNELTEKQFAEFNGIVESRALLTSKNGEEYQVSISSAPLRDTEGEVRGRVIVFRDETERLKTEKELFKAKKLESVGVLAGGIAHDFNNILAGLFGNIELANRKIPEDHAAYPYMQVAHQALDRATSLTKQLLTFAKGGEPILEAVSAQQVITEIVQFNLSGSQVKAVFGLPDELWPIKADKGQFGQVIENLTINAKHAMPLGGTLYINGENISIENGNAPTMISGDCIKLSVRDEGVGMTADLLDKIFDPYFTTKQTGSGLGLAAVRSIVEKHNGRINVESEPGYGTTFTIYLPADKDPRDIAKKPNQEPSTALLPATGRVLIVDDEELVQNVLVEMLAIIGCSADIADKGEAGKEKYLAAQNAGVPYALVIMDLTIPGGMGGEEATKEILAIDPDAKIIASSGYSTDPIMARFLDYGFSGRIVKPFRLDDVKREMYRVLNLNS
ncbi:MAG: cache domain-containing protein, partial [Desulfuromonadales bacterium]|nr:cache domain-containing protein [Desulfuromonadales bacterium]